MILDDIVDHKKKKLAGVKEAVSLKELENRIALQEPPIDFESALTGKGVHLIAEVKKASPSKGLLCPDFDPLFLACTYATNGAAAISVLTESRFFQGDLTFIPAIKKYLAERAPQAYEQVPLLRKDFLFDPYQVLESRANGADALLLIVSILDDAQLKELLTLSHDLGMKCLVEVHDEGELDRALIAGAGVIGINNRDLKTFVTDLAVTERLIPRIPKERVVVSESGIRNRQDVLTLEGWGVNAMLVGEALVVAPDVGERVKGLLGT